MRGARYLSTNILTIYDYVDVPVSLAIGYLLNCSVGGLETIVMDITCFYLQLWFQALVDSIIEEEYAKWLVQAELQNRFSNPLVS